MTLQQGPDWGPIGAAVAAVLTAIGGAIAAYAKWGGEKTAAKKDHAELTLDSVFRLVNELQEEVTNKAHEYVELDRRCNARIEALERRLDTAELTIRDMRSINRAEGRE